MLTNAKFVWSDSYIRSQCEEMEARLNEALSNSKVGVVPFLVELTGMVMAEKQKREEGNAKEHSSHTHEEFYLNLFDATLEAIQEPTDHNMTISMMLGYLDKWEFAGCAPMTEHRPVLGGDIRLGAVEPIFNVWFQDDKLAPESTLGLRVSVDKNGGIRTVILNSEWLAQAVKPKASEVIKSEKPKAIAADVPNRIPAKKKKAKALK